ncbi:uncharacterized protein HKW66_Vig0169410 [Vigna angularis]|uniref:Uncharacterized protein n=1 Tax=Phaseolus angularis TaxID=3914 RepID=A0A8T0JPL7_PHAAN|nr:uncharacterized protein HKW66_Vig0169410 [Vigna angularis]
MSSENLVASVLLVRRPVVIPKIDPVVYAFQEFSGKGDYQIDYVPAPRFTEADKNNDKREKRSIFGRHKNGVVWGRKKLKKKENKKN